MGTLLLLSSIPPSGAEGTPTEFIVGLRHVPAGTGPGGGFHGGKVVKVDPTLGYLVVSADAPGKFTERARSDGNVRYVHENEYVQFLQERVTPPVGDDVSVTYTPNDPSYGSMYGPQQIRANLAWDTTLGNTNAAVCIVDTGVRYTHEDITGSRWLGGHDYVNADTNPMDDHGHGTHVAGTAAATINNAKGIAGIGNVGIYGVKVLDAGGGGTWDWVASGIRWCADNTMARTVISLSLGGGGGAPVLQDAVTYAYTTKGKLVVAATGNDYCVGAGCVLYPAAYPEVVAVACTTSSGARCDFSNGGPETEIAAPGYDIHSTYHTSDAAYATMSGTSMSTPHVSGAAALVWSHHTSLTAAQLRQRLRDTAQDLGPAGWDAEFGYGEVDAKCLLDGTSPCGGSSPPGSVLWSEKFDSGSATGWTLSGLWRVTNCRSFSSPYSLGYNQGACPPNFNVGTTSGSAVSPSIAIAAGTTNLKLNWQGWHNTESGTTWDVKKVHVSTNGGSTWNLLHQEDGAQGAWNARSVDIASYAGSTIKLRFEFDSVDGVANDGEGWYVDNVEITGNAPTYPYTEKFDSGSAGGWTLSGLWRVTNCRSFSSPYSLGYNQGACPPNFNVGTTSGSAVSPAITVPSNRPSVTLYWKSWHSTESGPTYDKKLVYVTANDGVTWTQLHQEDGAQGTWNDRSVALSGYAGKTIKVRFHFDSVDGIGNTGEGWYVDDVRVAAPPTAPQGLSATPGPGVGQISLSWSAPASSGDAPVSSYRIYRNDGAGYAFLASVTGTSYVDSGLDVLKTYRYQVSAVNSVGEGARSFEACARPYPSGAISC